MVLDLKEFLTNLADFIRAKKGTTDPIDPQDFISELKTADNLLRYVNGDITELSAEDLDGCKQIDSYSFYKSGLVSIDIPESVTRIGTQAFADCTKLTTVTMTDSVKEIASNTFNGCKSLTECTLSSIITQILTYTFYKCESLMYLAIPASVVTISGNALRIGSAENMATLEMLGETPPTIQTTTIGADIEKIIVPDGCGEAYRNATNWSTYADIIVEVSGGGEVATEGLYYTLSDDGTYYTCSGIDTATATDTDICIPSTYNGLPVTTIGTEAFANYTKLTKVTIQEGVTRIKARAFAWCSMLTSMTIPESVTRIDVGALYIGSSTNKATITMRGSTPPATPGGIAISNVEKIIVPVGAGDAYKTATNWSNYADIIEEATE